MDAEAKGNVGVIPPRDVDVMGIVKHQLVPVRSRDQGKNPFAGPDRLLGHFDIFLGDAHHGLHRALKTQDLFDGAGQQAEIVP